MMHSSIEEIYNRTQRIPGRDVIAPISLLENAITKTARTIGQLHTSIISLSSVLQLGSFQVDNSYAIKLFPESIDPSYKPDKYERRGASKRLQQTEPEAAVQVLYDISKLFEGVGSITETIGNIYPKLGQLKRPLEAASTIAKTSEATATIMNSVENGAGITEGIVATSELLSGAALITELVSGPAGWALLAGTIAVGAMSHYVDREEKEQISKREAQARENQMKATMATFSMSSKEALEYRDHEINHLANSVARIKYADTTWSIDNTLQQQILKTEGRHTFEVFVPPSLAASDNTGAMLNIRPGLVDANENLPKPQQSYMQRTFPILQNFLSAGYNEGKKGFESEVVAATAKARMYDLHNKTGTVQDVRYAAREAAQFLTSSANAGKPDLIPFPGRSNTARIPGGATGNVVHINLNKSLIGQFTIQCNSTDDGIKEFKHKVEEVLLEILDSANTII